MSKKPSGKFKPEVRAIKSEEDQQALRTMEAEILNGKVILADLVLQQASIQQQVLILTEKYTQCIYGLAKGLGINPDDPSVGGYWDFKPDTQAFVRKS